MDNWVKICLVVLFAVATTGNEEATPAKLLFSKQILNKYLVEGMDIVIKYSLFNVGGTAALDVQLADNTFGPQDFEVVGGQLKVTIDRIPPGANASHVVVIRPSKFGYFNFTAAEVTYLPSEDAAEALVGLSSEPGQGAIVPFKEYDRKFSPHFLDWLSFAVMSMPCLVLPFALWYSSKSKYEALTKQKKEVKQG
uniref:Translocon-associated protein subunit beta n=1 Tax=Megafenestra aurita TaxID=2291010 RepID=A0A4Y7NJ98_9CRUS|nr:EOG090X0EPM [Megafenestra aurita]SVE92684.1 EOG090X0EPM [Megafenestra aurita]